MGIVSRALLAAASIVLIASGTKDVIVGRLILSEGRSTNPLIDSAVVSQLKSQGHTNIGLGIASLGAALLGVGIKKKK
ncbi:hypothetical protein OAL34_03295 [Synechococcus sp. AH-551-G03]|nr:hypothetical protein [Synechococcus sp. AH-551-G03]